jgi:cytidyltransferase-like protein
MNQFNSLVQSIQGHLEKKSNKEKLNESELPSFLSFKKSLDKKKVDYTTSEVNEIEEPKDERDDLFYSYGEFIEALEKVDSAQNPGHKSSEMNEDSDKEKKLEDVNLLVGRFQPFHQGHLKMASFLKEKNDLPSIVAVVHPGHNRSNKSPFDIDLVKRYMEALVKEKPDLISGFFIVNRGLLGVIYGTAKEHGFKVKMIGAGDDRIEDYKKQEEYLKKHGSDFPEDIEVVETPRSSSATSVREKLKDEDFLEFKKLVPDSVSSFYPQLVSALKGTDIKESEEVLIETSDGENQA